MRRYLILPLLLLLISFQSFAAIDSFEQSFRVLRENGKLVAIRDRSIVSKFSIMPLLNMIKGHLFKEQFLMKSKSDYRLEVEELFLEDMANKGVLGASDRVQDIIDSLAELEDLDIEAIFSAPSFKTLMTKVESRLSQAMINFDPNILANVQNPKFFYRRTVAYQITIWGINFIRKRLSSIPALNTASFVITEVERMLREKRVFRQNMLLHYLENYPAGDLGMTNKEVDLVLSSIYESRIAWFNFFESNAARANWNNYGVNRFFQGVRAANTTMRNSRDNYVETGKRINYAFMEATGDNGGMIINLFNTSNMFNSTPAVAYYYDRPGKVKRQRVLLQLAGLGLSFVPIPNFFKGGIESYFTSFYQEQQLTEGALFAHFKIAGNQEMGSAVASQHLNPFTFE
ncbi:MAG: hypothetical protein HN353_01105 [Bdellovibrionales bacterium]|jgi:hypothetical protein|nr:hypothetical protein [Bdellovibrionales bacterium]MBT3526732.1 hypothetical protein [Bdellovibrionales bacterium]MBT7669070.1 hypothetical protein [Bdellovibrionales bacterium]MBT7765766.1 hypothetical protein [Bdellovibrionales bacterium]